MAEASLVSRLKQARAQLFMHLDCGAGHLSSQLFLVKVSFRLHLLILRALRVSVVNYFFSSRIARRSEGISAIGRLLKRIPSASREMMLFSWLHCSSYCG